MKESDFILAKEKKVKVEISDIMHSKKKNCSDSVSSPTKVSVKQEFRKNEKSSLSDSCSKPIKQEPGSDQSKSCSKLSSVNKNDTPKKFDSKTSTSCREGIGSGISSSPRKKLDSIRSNKTARNSLHKISKTNHIQKNIKKELSPLSETANNKLESKSDNVHKIIKNKAEKLSLSGEKKNGTLTVKCKSQCKVEDKDLKKSKSKDKRKHHDDTDHNPKKYPKVVLLSQVPSSTLSSVSHDKNNIPKHKNSSERRSKSRHHFSKEDQQDLESAVVDCVACLVNTVRDQIEDMLTKQKCISSEAVRVRTASKVLSTDLSEQQTLSPLKQDCENLILQDNSKSSLEKKA